jgi:hypothetical protein
VASRKSREDLGRRKEGLKGRFLGGEVHCETCQIRIDPDYFWQYADRIEGDGPQEFFRFEEFILDSFEDSGRRLGSRAELRRYCRLFVLIEKPAKEGKGDFTMAGAWTGFSEWYWLQ